MYIHFPYNIFFLHHHHIFILYSLFSLVTRQGIWYGRKVFLPLSPFNRGVEDMEWKTLVLRSSSSRIEKPVDHQDPSQRMMEKKIGKWMCSIWMRIRITESYKGGVGSRVPSFYFSSHFPSPNSLKFDGFRFEFMCSNTHTHTYTISPSFHATRSRPSASWCDARPGRGKPKDIHIEMVGK